LFLSSLNIAQKTPLLKKDIICRKWVLFESIQPNYSKEVSNYSDSYYMDTIRYKNESSKEILSISSNSHYYIYKSNNVLSSTIDSINSENGNWYFINNNSVYFKCENNKIQNKTYCSNWQILELCDSILSIQYTTRGGAIIKNYKSIQ
jgi:hypothetical protein